MEKFVGTLGEGTHDVEGGHLEVSIDLGRG